MIWAAIKKIWHVLSRLLPLLITLVFSILFLFYNPEGEKGFKYSTMVLPIQTWYYFLFEHLSLLLLSIVLLIQTKEFKFAFAVFVGIQVIDTLDYLLTYATPWPFLPVSWNLIKVSIFGLTIIHQAWKHLVARS